MKEDNNKKTHQPQSVPLPTLQCHNICKASLLHTWLSHVADVLVCSPMCSSRYRDSFVCATWLIHMCDMTHSYVRHDSFTCATLLSHMWRDITYSHVQHDSYIYVTCLIYTSTWLIHMRDTSMYVLGLLILYACHTYEWIMLHVWMRHVTHLNESCCTFQWVMPHI